MKQEFLSFPRSAKLYLVAQFLMGGFFTWPFWYGYATGIITPAQFGVFTALIYIVGVAAEIPTGAFADKFGRKRSALLGAVAGMLAPLIVYFGGSFTAYIVMAFVAGLGRAFVSGSLESLVYELPGMTKSVYRRIMIQDTFFFQAGLIVAAATGGFMYQLNSFLPFAMEALSFLLAFVAILFIQTDAQSERGAKGEERAAGRWAAYLKTNRDGFLHLFSVRSLRALIVFGSILGVILWMSVEYVNEAAMIGYGIEPQFRGLLIAVAKLSSLVILSTLVMKVVKTDRQKLVYLAGMMGAVLVMYSFGSAQLFMLAFIGFNLVSAVRDNFIKPIIHDHIENRWRATAISSYSFVSNLLQGTASLGVGVMLQQKGPVFVQRVFLLLFLLVALPAVVRYLPRLKPNEMSAVSEPATETSPPVTP